MPNDCESEAKRVNAPDILETVNEILEIEDDYFTTDNVALVTGGASGIGEATAVALADNGLTVVATDIDEDGLTDTVRKAEKVNVDGKMYPVVGDLTEDADIKTIVEEAAKYGDIKYLANIAGMQHVAPLEEFPINKYDLMQDVMVRAPTFLAKLCIPHIRESQDGVGAVGNMASIHGHYTTKDKVAYNVAKFGIRGLTQSIAAEGKGDVRSFSVSTGYVKTPLVTNQIEDTAHSRGISTEEVTEDVMLGQARDKDMMFPVEVANLFIFGFSKHGKHLNGGDLRWDGGYTLTYD